MTEHVQRAAMPWAVVLMVLFFFVGTVLFVVLEPAADWMLDFAAGWHVQGDRGVETVRTLWVWLPLALLGMLGVFGLVEAIRHAGPGGVRR